MADVHEIDARVTKVLVQPLGVNEDDVTPSATLKGDLGAESIDFLDIMFRLEREFAIKIRQGELFPEAVFPRRQGHRAGWPSDRRGPGGAALLHALCRPEEPGARPAAEPGR